MFRETTAQLSVFTPEVIFPGILPKTDWCFIYRDKILPLIDESKFMHLYHTKDKSGKAVVTGAPNKSIQLQISILIFMGLEQLTWRAAEKMFERRIDWMIATRTSLGEAFIDHTTLFKFFGRLSNDDTALELFTDFTKAFILECGISTKQQRVDSFFMTGWLAILSRYGLFKETLRKFLQNLRKQKPGIYSQIKDDLSREYLEKEFDLTEKDHAKAQRKIKDMAKDMYSLIKTFESHKQIQNYETFKIMLTVFEQQCVTKKKSESSEKESIQSQEEQKKASKKTKRTKKKAKKKTVKDQKKSENSPNVPQKKEPQITEETTLNPLENEDDSKSDNCNTEIEIRKIPEGDKIISSPHNTDAEYVKKRKQKIVGHKGFISETCDRSNPIQMITDVNLEKSTHSDSIELNKIVDRLQEQDLMPKELFADAGFISGQTLLDSEEKGLDLVGPVSGRSQNIEQYEKNERPLNLSDFSVVIDHETGEITIVSCPKKYSPAAQKRSDKTGKVLVHFSCEDCFGCTFIKRCPIKIGKRINTLTVSEEQYAGAVRHNLYMEDVEYRKKCSIRAGAESLVNEVANSHNGRKSRHRPEKSSRLQLIFGVIACNVKRYLGFQAKSAQVQMIKN